MLAENNFISFAHYRVLGIIYCLRTLSRLNMDFH